MFILGSIVFVWFAAGLPSSEKLLAYQPPLPTNVRGYNGNPVQTFARERRVELAFDEYPPLVVNAFISAEDKTFFSHGGLDYPGLTKAVFNYTLSAGRGRVPGGSTITQQVAKYLLQDDEYAISRKIREMILAFRLEDTLSKEQILELYLNSIFLGRNAYGVQAASRAYFDKDVADLTLPEAAYLAVLPKAPSNYDPVRATARALGRRNYVLREMADNGKITEDAARCGRRNPAGHDPLRQQRQVPRPGRLFHGRGPARPAEAVRRRGGRRLEQRLCRRPVGAHVDDPRHAGCRGPGASRGAGEIRRRARLARHRPQHRCRWRLADPAPRHGARHRIRRLEEGRRAVQVGG